MQPQIKQMNGVMDLDSPNDVIGRGSHSIAYNGRFRGIGNNLRFETIAGTTLITNNLPAGNNENIGAIYDGLKKRIIFANYNSSGNHGIYIFSTESFTVTPLIITGTNTIGDPLRFTLNGFIANMNILYGDDQQGDIFYFLNSQKEPCQININQQLAGSYGIFQRSFFDVCKEPLSVPLYVTYENDSTVKVNNLRKKVIKFKGRKHFNNKDRSVTSSQGVLPLPVNWQDSAIDKDPTKNCRIAITIETGDSNVKKLEILGAIAGAASGGNTGTPNTFGDYFSIITLDKAELGIPDNDLYTYRFFNDQAYLPIDVKESIQEFDWVPLQANAQELLNGNVPVYGGILEGYDKVVSSNVISTSSIIQRTTQPPYTFACSQSGDSGFGTGNIHTVVIGTIAIGNLFTFQTTNQTISFAATATTTANVIAGLSAAATVAGFTIISSDTENLVVIKTGESLLRFLATPIVIAVSDSFVYDWNSRYSFGIVYFDAKGRTNGVVFPASSIQTNGYSESSGTPTIPKILFSISGRPPIWATYYQIVRTKNTTKADTFYWISDKTFKDATYAYISIESLNAFIKTNPSSKFLAYGFSPNDRIRFIKVLSGSVNTIYTQQDFEIIEEKFDPEINGVVQIGQYLKIALPATSGTFDFGTSDFYNYFINLYTPAESASEGLDVYYEFGERYAIGNAGTINAFHQGMLQNQTSNLVTPATFEFTQGDNYYRNRIINTGDVISYKLIAGTLATSTIIGQAQVSESLPNTNFTTALTVTQQAFINNYNSPGWTINVNTFTYTFAVTGTINLRTVNSTTAPFIIQIYVVFGTTTVLYVLGNKSGPTAAGVDVIFNVSQSIVMPPNSKAFLVMNTTDNAFRVNLVSGNLIYTQSALTYTVGCPDPSFSDYFEANVNSNGRTWANDPNATQSFIGNILRWGLNYEALTNLNLSNRFYFENFDEIDLDKGDIMRFKVRERIMRIFQKRACSQVGIYTKFVQDSGNTNILTTTDDIIAKNNVQYQGSVGIGDYATNLASATIADYFVNPYTGEEYRLSNDGLINLSEKYLGEYTIKQLLTPYTNNYLRPNGSTAKIIKYFDFLESNAGTILQAGIYNGENVPNYNFSFNEPRNAFGLFYNIFPDFALGFEDKVAYWKNGQLYINNNDAEQNKFFGTQFGSSIKLIFNDQVAIKKVMDAISYQSNKVWVSDQDGDILTSYINQQTELRQSSNLIEQDFSEEDGLQYAALLCDKNSGEDPRLALVEGDVLQGNWISIVFRYRGSEFSYLYLPSLIYQINQRNY